MVMETTEEKSIIVVPTEDTTSTDTPNDLYTDNFDSLQNNNDASKTSNSLENQIFCLRNIIIGLVILVFISVVVAIYFACCTKWKVNNSFTFVFYLFWISDNAT